MLEDNMIPSPSLQTVMLGKWLGNFRFDHLESRAHCDTMVANIHKLIFREAQLPFWMPKANFSNRVVKPSQTSEWEAWGPALQRTRQGADGVIVEGLSQPVAVCNGDCPLLCLWQDQRLAVLHAGYRCLIRQDPTEPDLVQNALAHFDPKQVQAWIGFGIGPCCWVPGYKTKPEILNPALARNPELLKSCLSRTTRSPLGPGHVSVDLLLLARLLLLECGVPNQQIAWNNQCSCCEQDWGTGKYRNWSLTRWKAEGGVDGRNFAVAYLTS